MTVIWGLLIIVLLDKLFICVDDEVNFFFLHDLNGEWKSGKNFRVISIIGCSIVSLSAICRFDTVLNVVVVNFCGALRIGTLVNIVIIIG